MKTIIALVMTFLLAGCSSKEKEEFTPYPGGEFTPYPGGKCCEEKPKS